MKVILISGKAGHGKDQFSQYLQQILTKQNKRVLVIHFADMVKEYAKLYYQWDGQKDEKGRHLLQWLGTDTVRAHFPNYWADLVAQFIKSTETDWDVVLIPDLRFLNEYNRVKKYNENCIGVRITRFNSDGTEWENPALTQEQHNHPSETDLDDYSFDYYVANDGDLTNLWQCAEDLIFLLQ